VKGMTLATLSPFLGLSQRLLRDVARIPARRCTRPCMPERRNGDQQPAGLKIFTVLPPSALESRWHTGVGASCDSDIG